MPQILEVIDAMYAAKMNVFHFHVTDAPSFPYPSKLFPELAAEGSWSQDGRTTYTAAEIEALVDRARRRYVQLVLEFDAPAHTMSWARSHPEIMAQCWQWLAQENPKVDVDSDDCMAMDPTSPAARSLVSRLLAEAADTVGAHNRFLHLGGDEVKPACWNSVAAIANYTAAKYGNTSDAAYRQLQVQWTREVTTAAAVAAGKTPVLWQSTSEGPLDPAWAPASAGLPNTTVMMAWLSAQSVADYARAGQPVVSTIGFYIATDGVGGWESIRETAVVPPGLPQAQQELVLGGQVCIWGETFNAAALPVLAYSVAMGAAENYWGRYDGNGGGSGTGSDSTSTGVAGAAAAAGDATYWWQFNASDCAGDDVPGDCPGTPDKVACCSGQSLEACQATCMSTTGCGGFNFPHGILKKGTCMSKKAPSVASSTLYVKASTPQPAPPPPPQWTGAWALRDRYNHFLCHLGNVGVQSPPSMPSYCGA